MSSWFIIINIILLFSSISFLQAHFRAPSKRRYPVPNVPFVPSPPSLFDDDSLIESTTTIKSKNHANEEQMKQFTRLLFDRLNLKEPPNVTTTDHHGPGIPSIVKQLEKEHIQQIEEIHAHQRQKNREEIQPTTERAILPGDFIPHHTCQRQLMAKLNLNKDSLQNIDCFRFTKSTTESKSLPTNQIIKQLRIYIKKNFFYFNHEQENMLKPHMFQIYQVFRPTSNDTLANPLPGLTDTIRLLISQVKELNRHWFELTVDPNSGPINIQQIYQQFIMPWYGLAINHVLQSSWPSFYRRYYSKKNLENLLRTDDEENESKETQQLPYMLVEYGERIPSSSSSSSGRRGTREASPHRPPQSCDPKSPCCRRPLIIDFDQANHIFNFVIYPRKIDIGECIGLCGTSGSSLKHTEAKNNPNSAYGIMVLHQNSIFPNRSTSTAQSSKPDQQSNHCCSYSRTGGIEIMYTTTNGGPILRKFIPNMVVEECRCGLPATIQQIPPSIRAQSTLVHSTIGKSVQLRCTATVPFDTKIYWQRMDNHTMSKFRQQQQTQGYIIQTSLYIKDSEKNDFGLYGCFAESTIGKSHAVIELREHRRSTNSQIIEKDELSTSRIQILKRNKISDQTTISIKTNKASTCFSLFDLSIIFIQIIFYNLT